MREYAAVLVGDRQVTLQQYPTPEIGSDDALLEVELSGVCGTDYAIYTGQLEGPRPLVLGHEILGRLASVGANASERWGVVEGDRVVMESIVPCWGCAFCYSGAYRFCERRLRYGTGIDADKPPHLWGSMVTSLYVAPGAVIHKIPDSVSPSSAVLAASVLGNGVRWVQHVGEVRQGMSVVVRGAGPQGIACAAVAVAIGAAPVILLGRSVDRERLAFAQSLGVEHVIAVDDTDVVELVSGLRPGGVDVVVDASGAADVMDEDIELLRPLGRLVWAGVLGKDTVSYLRADRLIYKEVDIRGVFTKDHTAFNAAIELVQRSSISFDRMVTHVFSLDQAEEAILAVGGESSVKPIKAVIDPSAVRR